MLPDMIGLDPVGTSMCKGRNMRALSIDPKVAKTLQASRQHQTTRQHDAEEQLLSAADTADALKSVVRQVVERGHMDESVVKAALWALVDQGRLKVTLGGKVMKV